MDVDSYYDFRDWSYWNTLAAPQRNCISQIVLTKRHACRILILTTRVTLLQWMKMEVVMQTKGDRTKQVIVDKSKKLFSQKGYTVVTMKDVCEICDLSRGGLYRHFGSTKEIFLEILNEDKEEMRHQLEQSIKNNASADFLFEYFLKQHKEIIQNNNGMALAIHEFSFAEKDQSQYMNDRFHIAIELLMQLMDYGQEQGVFKNFDTGTMATHIVFLLDSIETSASTLIIPEKMLDNQLNFLKKLVMK